MRGEFLPYGFRLFLTIICVCVCARARTHVCFYLQLTEFLFVFELALIVLHAVDI